MIGQFSFASVDLLGEVFEFECLVLGTENGSLVRQSAGFTAHVPAQQKLSAVELVFIGAVQREVNLEHAGARLGHLEEKQDEVKYRQQLQKNRHLYFVLSVFYTFISHFNFIRGDRISWR